MDLQKDRVIVLEQQSYIISFQTLVWLWEVADVDAEKCCAGHSSLEGVQFLYAYIQSFYFHTLL